MEPLFSNGLYLANLTVSSSILTDSWNAISEHQGNKPVKIIKDHPDYDIIAIVSSPVTASRLQKEKLLVPMTEISAFRFPPDTLPTFSINGDAEFAELQGEVEKNEKEGNIIITGRCLNGSVASFYTLSLLNRLDPTKFKLLCITFGSPLLRYDPSQQAVSPLPTWNSNFLHVVHKDDSVSRLFPVPPHKTFGTFLLCSELGGAYFQAPESVIELLKYKNPEVDENHEARNFNYKNVVECLEKKLLERDYEAGITGQVTEVLEGDYEAGITVQVTEVGLRQHQQQNQDISALIKNIVAREKIVLKQQREEFDPEKELNEMKVYLALMEWYMKKCRADGHGSGYYDSFKNARERRDNGVDKYKTYLTDYWEKVVDDARKKPPTRGAPLRPRLLYGGTTYRRIVEPLDIAEYYRRGRKDYENRGRSDHYKLLEKWLKDYQEKNPPASAGLPKLKVENVTGDSCFWARVEEAIRSCRRLDRDRAGEGAKLIQFEKYVRDLIDRGDVSPDIFLEKSSYMQWWREYEESLKKVEGGSDSDPSGLVDFMKKHHYINYGKGFTTDSNENPSDTSRSGPSTSGDPHGSQRVS